jgi:hypothetical protein
MAQTGSVETVPSVDNANCSDMFPSISDNVGKNNLTGLGILLFLFC